jgi:hypothetical protein
MEMKMPDRRPVDCELLTRVLAAVFTQLGEELNDDARGEENHDASRAIYAVAAKVEGMSDDFDWLIRDVANKDEEATE